MGCVRTFMALPLLLCACGGGGGGGAGANNADQQAALQLLEDCGLGAIADFLDALDIAVEIVDPNGTSLPAIDVIAVEQMQGHILWSADLGGDPAPELNGDIQFLNNMGQPAEPPFDLMQFMPPTGLGGLDAFLTQLPDGWTVRVSISTVGQPSVVANIFFSYAGGAADHGGGTVSAQDTPCGANYSFSNTPFADLVGAFPMLQTASTYTSGGTTLAGMTTFDGTDVATVDGGVNGGTAVYTFEADLGAQTVTAVP